MSRAFAQQMAETRVGWVIFCIDDHYFAWPCAPNKAFCGMARSIVANVYHGWGDDNQFSDQELIDWINTCEREGSVCALDGPFDPKTGLLKGRQMEASGPRPSKNAVVEGGLTVEVPPLSADKLPCEHAYTIKLTQIEGTSTTMNVRSYR